MKRKPKTFEQRLVGALAAARTKRTRLYAILGHKKLDDGGPQLTEELRLLYERSNVDAIKLANVLWRVRVHLNAKALAAHVKEHSGVNKVVRGDGHAAHVTAHAKLVG